MQYLEEGTDCSQDDSLFAWRPRWNEEDFVFFIPPPPFFEGTRAEFDVTLDNCWYGRVVLLFRIRVKTDEKDGKGRSGLKVCDCAMIDCLYDYAEGRSEHVVP